MNDYPLPDSIAEIANLMCGCGDPESVWAQVKCILETARDRGFYEPVTGGDWFLAYVLGVKNLTEHGTGVRGAWLLPKGEEALEFLTKWGADWADKGYFVDSDGVSHGHP